MSLPKKVTKSILNLLWRYKPGDSASRIIYYHSVHPTNTGSLRPATFRSHLKWLFDNGYTCPVLSEFETYYEREKVVFITFDDGYQDNWDYAVPILNEFNFKATFFICSGYTNKEGNFNASEGHQLSDGLKMLNEDSLVSMKNAGMEIGSHGVSHRMMSRISPDEQYQELLLSKNKLEQLISERVNTYAFPNGQKGACTEYANDVAKRLGYQLVCSTLWGKCNKLSSMLNRCEISCEDGLHEFVSKIIGKRDYRMYVDALVDKSKTWQNAL